MRLSGLLILGFFCVYSAPAFAEQKPKNKICPAGKHWVRAHHRSAYIRADGAHVSAAEVIAHCHPNPPGFAEWQPKIRDRLPKDWPLKENGKSWTEEERERLVEVLMVLPDELLKSDVEGIYRGKRSGNFPNPASNDHRSIALYDTAFTPSKNLARILAHEFAHMIFGKFSVEDREAYEMATNWFRARDKTGKLAWSRRATGFVEPDGILSSEEDFANNVEYFLFYPEKLRKITPNAYNWINAHFGKGFRLRKGKMQ